MDVSRSSLGRTDEDAPPARALRRLAMATGVSCTAIGIYHLAGGVATVPGATSAGATVDSRERFYNAVFLGYGLTWVWTARQRPLPLTWIRGLAGVFLLGGLARLLSLAVHGKPHWFQLPLTAIELALPPVYLRLARAADPSAPDRGDDSTRGGCLS